MGDVLTLGGIAFDTAHDSTAPISPQGQRFKLYANIEEAKSAGFGQQIGIGRAGAGDPAHVTGRMAGRELSTQRGQGIGGGRAPHLNPLHGGGASEHTSPSWWGRLGGGRAFAHRRLRALGARRVPRQLGAPQRQA